MSAQNRALGQDDFRAEEAARLIEDLSSPFFIVRQKALGRLAELGPSAIPHLRDGLESAEPLIAAGCIDLLIDSVADAAVVQTVKKLTRNDAQVVRLAAIRFVAGHPDADDTDTIEWARGLLAAGAIPECKAYLEGVRRPAPAFQTGLIAETLPLLPDPVRAAAVRALSRGHRDDAAARLEQCYRLVKGGQLGEGIVPVLLDGLAECAVGGSFEAIVDNLLSPSALVAQKADRALAALVTHLSRSHDHGALIDLARRLAHLFADDHGARIGVADTLIRYGGDLSEAERIVLDVRRRLSGDDGTGALIVRAEASLALGLIAFRREEDWRTFLHDLPAGLEQTPGDYADSVRARALLLEGALTAAGGGDGVPYFLKALEVAPYEPDAAMIDALITGRFSLWRFVWVLSRSGGEAEAGAVLAQLTDALRKDESRSHYYPSVDELPSLDDRVRSSIPMTYGSFLRSDAGDLDAATEQLDEFIRIVEESILWRNLDLAVQALFVRGAAELERGDCDGARQSVGKGVKICEDLLSEYRTAREREGFRVYDDMIEAAERSKALGLLQLATIETLRSGSPQQAARLINEAVHLAPELTEVQMARALLLARQGHRPEALDIGAAVEEYPEQFYNKACLFLLVGEKEKALDCLEKHFGVYVRPLRVKIAREWALRDPDLEGLRKNTRFRELTGSGE